MAGVLLQDQEVRGAEFQQLAYHRILIMLFLELNAPEQVLDSINFQARFFFPIFFFFSSIKLRACIYNYLFLNCRL